MNSENGKRAETETQKIMDDALRRALNTPPKPHQAKKNWDGKEAASKPRRKAERDA